MSDQQALREWLESELEAVAAQHDQMGKDREVLAARYESIQITLAKMAELESGEKAPAADAAEAKSDQEILTGTPAT